MATVDSDRVVCGGIHAMTAAVLVSFYFCVQCIFQKQYNLFVYLFVLRAPADDLSGVPLMISIILSNYEY
jgi:hypothetical protein